MRANDGPWIFIMNQFLKMKLMNVKQQEWIDDETISSISSALARKFML